MAKLDSQMVLIFGGTGDLARRKLIPSLYHLEKKGQLTSCTPIVCLGRQEYDRQGFLASLAIDKSIDPIDREVWRSLAERIEYRRLDLEKASAREFADCVEAVRGLYACADNTLVYLALPTRVFAGTAVLLKTLQGKDGWLRVVFEKPFGEDSRSAAELQAGIRSVLSEEQIFRVDHYLGKELVRNILTLRFANAIFSNAWDRNSIDHVQITVCETLGVEKRAEYYERSGAVRDMAQNHLLQLLSFVAMEPPPSDDAEAFRDEAARVLQASSSRFRRRCCPGTVCRGNRSVRRRCLAIGMSRESARVRRPKPMSPSGPWLRPRAGRGSLSISGRASVCTGGLPRSGCSSNSPGLCRACPGMPRMPW